MSSSSLSNSITFFLLLRDDFLLVRDFGATSDSESFLRRRRDAGVRPLVLRVFSVKMEICWSKVLQKLRSTDAAAKRQAFKTKKKTKTVNNLCSHGYSQWRCHSQYNVKLGIIAPFKQRENLLRPKRFYSLQKILPFARLRSANCCRPRRLPTYQGRHLDRHCQMTTSFSRAATNHRD